jgi:predicted RecA/RadA family phage recombinase
MSETWYLIHSKDKNAYDLVEEASIISGDVVHIGDMVTFFYRNKPFTGKVKDKSGKLILFS